jgi:glycosyltransferase involved in cell wall biosynthesis
MLTIDTITIVVGAIILVLALTTPFLNGLLRKPKGIVVVSDDEAAQEYSKVSHTAPPVSIILTPHENAHELEHYLPLILEQDYPDFEVIVVTWKGDSDTEDVLKRFADNPHLYYTYIPDSSRYMSRKKLAVTLGVKAAKNEWILLTDAQCYPTSTHWLSTMASNCHKNINLVYGYTRYDVNTPAFWRFERLHTNLYLLREAQSKTAYRHNSCNLMFRKSEFISNDGYRGNLKYLRGEYDFIVNKYAQKGATAVELRPESWLTEQQPTQKEWRNKHLFYLENRQHMARNYRHRWLFNFDQTALHVNYLLILAAIIVSIITQRWILTAIAVIALAITICLRIVIGKKTIQLFQEDISTWKIIPYEIRLFWNMAAMKYKYLRSDENDFISHKL